jgi:hypothetical protein
MRNDEIPANPPPVDGKSLLRPMKCWPGERIGRRPRAASEFAPGLVAVVIESFVALRTTGQPY